MESATETPPPPKFKVTKKLGSGGENDCWQLEDGRVIKFTNKIGRLWANHDPEYIRKTIELFEEILGKVGISILKPEIIGTAEIEFPGGGKEIKTGVTIWPFVENLEQNILSYEDLFLALDNKQFLEALINLVEAMWSVRYLDKMGIDPIGFEALWAAVGGTFSNLINLLPPFLRRALYIDTTTTAVKGRISNVIKTTEGTQLVDIGTHDFSENIIYRLVFSGAFHLNIGTLIGLVEIANKRLEEPIEPEELKKLKNPFSFLQSMPKRLASFIALKISKTLFRFMMPAFNRNAIKTLTS